MIGVRETSGVQKMKVAFRCDICREERPSVREGNMYLCDRCLDFAG